MQMEGKPGLAAVREGTAEGPEEEGGSAVI